MTLLDSLLEGMDTPDGFVAGSASYLAVAGPFFPMFSSLRAIFPPPVGWGATEAAVLSTFVCLALKTFMHSFGRNLKFEAETIKMCGAGWILAFFYHYITKTDQYTQDHDPINLLVYGALFALPTFAFSAMQIHAAKRST